MSLNASILFCVLSLLTIGSLVLIFLLREKCNFLSDNTPECLLPEKFAFEHRQQKHGEDTMRKSTVVVCGLARNCSSALDKSIPMVKKLCKKFHAYKILVVENDSVDDTRNKLLKWTKEDHNVEVLGCGVNAPKCDLKLKATVDHEVNAPRIEKMALLRNLYLDVVKEKYRNYDYMVVFDFDIRGVMYMDGIADSFGLLSLDSYINGVTANGIRKDFGFGTYGYYDTFALFSQESPSCFKNSGLKKQDEQEILQHGTLPSKNKDKFYFSPSTQPFAVKSAFAGLGIYRISTLVNKNASYTLTCSYGGKITCEHTALSESVGNIVLNPKMILLVFSH